MRVFIPLILAVSLLFTGCSIINSGKDLNAFTGRLSKLYSSEDFSEEGYIRDESTSSFIRFFECGEECVLLKLTYDSSLEITSLTVSGETGALESDEIRLFIKNSVTAFLGCETENTEIPFDEIFKNLEEISPESKTIELRDAEIIIDVAKLGWVITVFYDI